MESVSTKQRGGRHAGVLTHTSPYQLGQEPGKRQVEDATGLRSKLAKDGRLRTGDKVVLLVKSIYSWVNANGAKFACPAESLKVAPTRHAAQSIRDDQLHAVLTALSEESNPVARAFLTVAMFTGARRSNVLAMRWRTLNKAGKVS